MKRLFITASLLAIISFGNDIYAQGMGMGPGMMREGFDGGHPMRERHFFGDPEELKESLDLSDSQIEAISTINEKMRTEFKKYKKEIRPKLEKLRKLIMKEDVKVDEVRTILKQISEIEVEIRLLKIKHRLELEKVLTPEQKSKMIKEAKKRHRHDD